MRKKRSWPNLRYYPVICRDKNVRDLNPGPAEYEGVLSSRSRHSVGTITVLCILFNLHIQDFIPARNVVEVNEIKICTTKIRR
jgi:hypothetical protein